MRTLVLHTLSLAVAASLSAQGNIGAPFASNNAPTFGAGVLASTVVGGEVVQSIDQIELRSLGGATYRCTFTAEIVGQNDSKMVSGLLVLAGPPLWLPNNDVESLNTVATATDEFQCSISPDGLTCVWDNYAGTTYPNSGLSTSFICNRNSTSNAFNVNDARAMVGVPGGGCDPHIGGRKSNGDVIVYYLTGPNISHGDFNPLTGTQSNTAVAVVGGGNAPGQTPGTVIFCHSPTVQLDSSGNARGLVWSEYIGSGSDGLYTEAIDTTGTPRCLAQRDFAGSAHWFANPAAVGGSLIWATATGGYGDPSQFNGNMVCNTNLRNGGGKIPIYAPMAPGAPFPVYWSVVAVGSAAPPYQIPPVIGDILLFPTVGVLELRLHIPDDGYAEYSFGPIPVLNASFDMQIVTIDTSSNLIYAGNVATLLM
jgi:hypothetical protein